MRGLIDFFIRRSFTVNLAAGVIIAAGLVALTAMNRDLVPPLRFKTIHVNASLPGASAVDVEKQVTFPIEETIKDLPGIKKMKSVTQDGSTRIEVYFQADHSNMQESVETIRSRVDGLEPLLPAKLLPVRVQQIKIDTVQFLGIHLHDVKTMDQIHRDWILALSEEIRKIPGIVNINSSLERKNVYIDFDSDRLNRFGISVSEVRSKLTDHISYQPIGIYRDGGDLVSVEVKKITGELQELENLPVKGNRSGNLILLKDIANVEVRGPDQTTLRFNKRKPRISLWVEKDLNSDSIQLRKRVSKIIDEYNEKFPKPLKAEILFDGTYFIERQLNVLKNNGLTGFVLVLLVLIYFLGLRTALVTALGLPVAYLGTVLVLNQMDINIDLISVVGLILVIGILVDDAIIVAERYCENLSTGMPKRKAALDAAHSLVIPVSGTIVTTIVAFSPMLLVTTELSTILFSVPVVVVASLLLSWIECFFILPNHLVHFVPSIRRSDQKLFDKAKKLYERLLEGILHRRYWFLGFLAAFFAGTIWLAASQMKQDFKFRIGSERVRIFMVLKDSDSHQETLDAIRPIEDYVDTLPQEKIHTYLSRVGSTWMNGKYYEGYKYARITIFVPKTLSNPREVKEELTKIIQKDIGKFKTDKFEKLFVQREIEGSEDTKSKTVTIFVGGGDQISFESIQEEIRSQLRGVKSAEEVFIDPDRLQRTWHFYVDHQAMLRYGLSGANVGAQLAEYFSPQDLGRMRHHGEQVYIYSQAKKKSDLEYEDLNTLEVVTPRGVAVPTRFLGRWKEIEVLKKIEHTNLLRSFEMDVRFNEESSSVDEIKKEVSERLDPLRAKYPSYELRVKDGDEQAEENKAWALRVAALCIIFILFVLALTLGSLTQPFIVGLAVPFGITGIIWALFFHGMDLGVMAIIGLIGTAGVSVNDSLIMVDTINRRNRFIKGLRISDLIAGASSRLRAITITSVTTIGGVLPMAYGVGGESGFTQPLAFAIAWGLLFSTLLTLFAIPNLLAIREDIRSLLGRVIKKTRA